MSTEENYRRAAAEFRGQARAEINASARLELELFALSYDRLADQAERNARNNVCYEYDPETTAERRQRRRQLAQVQQQQQQQPPPRRYP